MKNKKSIELILLFISAIVVLYLAGGKLNYAYIKSNLNYLIDLNNKHPFYFITIFISFSAILTGLALPFSTILTIAGGAIFGTKGTIISLISYSIGTAISIFIARYFLRDFLLKKYLHKINQLNIIAQKNPRLLVFSIRLTPLIPFFIANFLLGLLNLPLKIILVFGFLGKIPLTYFFNYLGSLLKNVDNPEALFNFYPLIFLTCIAFFPWIIKEKIKSLSGLKNI